MSGLAVALGAVALVVAVGCRQAPPAPSAERLAAELDRWTSFAATASPGDDLLTEVKSGAGPLLAASRDAAAAGRPWLATERLLAAAGNLGGAEYLAGLPAAVRQDQERFAAEWERVGADLKARPPASLAGVTPAVLRALGEVALPQVSVYYDASLDYGRNTMPDAGLFYLGAAQAQLGVAELVRELSVPAPWWSRRELLVRSYAAELDRLEAELLAVYQPPLAIDRHAEFIAASATIKEARELDARGLGHGALLRTLQAARRVAPLRAAGAGAPVDNRSRRAELAAEIRRFADGLAARGGDQSIGQLFVEIAEADLQASAAPAGDAAASDAAAADAAAPNAAATVVDGVLPLYAALLGEAPPAPPPLVAQTTVTLVRWPYT